jgi:hypothetical protein
VETTYLLKTPKERDHSAELGIDDGRIILK